MTADALHHLADVEEIRIGFRRPDGSTGSTRSGSCGSVTTSTCGRCAAPRVAGIDGCANPGGEVRDGEHRHLVHAEVVTDAGTLAEVTRAYATKYSGSPFVRPLLVGPSVGAILRQDRPDG
jgi:hypothetical protein